MEPVLDASLATTPLPQEQRVARLGDRAVAAVMDGVVFFPIFAATPALAAYLYRIPRTPEGTISLEGGPALLSMTLDAVPVVHVLLRFGMAVQHFLRKGSDGHRSQEPEWRKMQCY